MVVSAAGVELEVDHDTSALAPDRGAVELPFSAGQYEADSLGGAGPRSG